MDRKELLDKLTNVRPALATKDFIEVFTCFCFTGESVFAYDDLISIKAPLELPIKGAVKGAMLLDLLKSIDEAQIELSQVENSLKVKSARSSLKLPMLSDADFYFTPADIDGDAVELPITDKMLSAFTKCLLSATNDSSQPSRMGITLTVGDDGESQVTAYSTDGVSLTSAIIGQAAASSKGKYILPCDFCRVLVDLAASVEGAKALRIASNGNKVVANVGEYQVTTKLVAADPIDFPSIIKQFFEGADKFVPVAAGMDNMLMRSELIMKGNNNRCTLTVKDNVLSIETASTYGEVKDTFALNGEHEDVEVAIKPALMRRVLDYANQVQVNSNAVILVGEEYIHLISVTD